MAKTEEQVEVRIPRKEYERLLRRSENQKRSGRMSLRLPFALVQALDARAEKTGLPKSRIVVDALQAELKTDEPADVLG